MDFNIPEIAKLVAGRFYAKVDANPSNFIDKDLSDELAAQQEVEQVLQDLVDVETISDNRYEALVDSLMKHPEIETVLLAAQAMVNDLRSDLGKTHGEYYGVRQSDFI